MDIQILKDSLEPWVRTSTWHTSHVSDEKRFNQALSSAFASLGVSISFGDFRDATRDLTEKHHPGLLKSEHIQQHIDQMAQRAEYIASYLGDTGGI